MDLNKSSISLSLSIASAFEFEYKALYSVLSSHCTFLNSSVATNLKPLNSDNKSISIFLVADSVYLSYS